MLNFVVLTLGFRRVRILRTSMTGLEGSLGYFLVKKLGADVLSRIDVFGSRGFL